MLAVAGSPGCRRSGSTRGSARRSRSTSRRGARGTSPFPAQRMMHPGAASRLRVRIVIATVPVIRAPLPHIPAHIVQPQRIGQQQAHVAGCAPAVLIVPAHLLQHLAACIAEAFFLPKRAATSGIFPLRFGGQAVFGSGQFLQPGQEFLSDVIPGNMSPPAGAGL
jgi:hypothetical protein